MKLEIDVVSTLVAAIVVLLVGRVVIFKVGFL